MGAVRGMDGAGRVVLQRGLMGLVGLRLLSSRWSKGFPLWSGAAFGLLPFYLVRVVVFHPFAKSAKGWGPPVFVLLLIKADPSPSPRFRVRMTTFIEGKMAPGGCVPLDAQSFIICRADYGELNPRSGVPPGTGYYRHHGDFAAPLPVSSDRSRDRDGAQETDCCHQKCLDQ